MEGRRGVYMKQRREIECVVQYCHQPQPVLGWGGECEERERIVLPMDSKDIKIFFFGKRQNLFD